MYNTLFQEHAKLLKALSHPKRLEIIHLLRDRSFCVGEMHRMLGLPQANVSQHLQILRAAGVVTTDRNGKEITYQLSHANYIEACDLVREVLAQKMKDADLISKNMLELMPIVHDPVCQMRLSPKTTSYIQSYKGNTYFFCAEGCLHTFQKNPAQYVGGKNI